MKKSNSTLKRKHSQICTGDDGLITGHRTQHDFKSDGNLTQLAQKMSTQMGEIILLLSDLFSSLKSRLPNQVIFCCWISVPVS